MMLSWALLLMLLTGSKGTVTGRDFVVSFFEKYRTGGPFLPHKFFIFLSEVNTTVHVESVGFRISDHIDVVEMTHYKYEIDKDNYYQANLEVTNMTFHVTSAEDITLFCYNYEANFGDGYIALPVSVLSTDYMIVTNTRVNNNPVGHSELLYTGSEKSVFLVIATEDNTIVSINLRMRGDLKDGGCGNGTLFDGDTNTYTLDQYEILGAYCEDDITGTIVSANKPVAVLSGHNYDKIIPSSSSYLNHLIEMLLPLKSLGRNFILLEPPNQSLGGRYRIVGSQASTEVRSTIGVTFTVNKGEPYDLDVNSTTGPVYLEADKPVTVVQFSKSRSSMTLVPPTSLYASTYDLGKVIAQVGQAANRQFKDLYLTVTVPTDMVLGMQPDIFPQFTVIEGSCFSFATTILQDIGFHRVSHDQGVPFGAMLHVYSAFSGHYSHPGGFNITGDVEKNRCLPSGICSDGTPYPCSCTLGYFGYQCNDTSPGCTVGPCEYNSTCDEKTNSYICDCVDGSGGAHCEYDINDNCQDNLCVNGTCFDELKSYTCECTHGFEGVYCDINIDECASSPCVNGTCNDLVNMYNCTCMPGFEGVICDTEINECDSNPCLNGGTCSDLIGAFECSCVGGFNGTLCENDIDECLSDPCHNGGSCSDWIDSYNCSCVPGYTGTQCDTDINECASNPCVNGSCNNYINMYNCTCSPGYEGDLCDTDIDECLCDPCQNGGTCIDLINSYNCSCAPGYMGSQCNIDIDECASNPCVNGSCNNYINTYNCTCSPGYEGDLCDTDIDECVSDPCLNGGSCIDLIDSYNCSCVPGYTGTHCDTDIDECASYPCVNGSCNNYINMYNCTCSPGYEGDLCDTDTDECLSDPCQNGGTCIDLINSYNCSCTPGYMGIQCDTDIDECASNPCVNGNCNNYVNMYNCTCTSGYEGELCDTEVDECDSSPCQNSAVCKDQLNAFECECLPGYNGSLCDNEIDECSGQPCLNGGNCTDGVNGYNCTCPEGINGTNCEHVSCALHPCKNNGTCTDSDIGFKCSCMPGFQGVECETDFNECASSPCKNEGTCVDDINTFHCLCPANFTGFLCELFLNCGCPCLMNSNITDEDLLNRINWWKSILLLDKSKLSKQARQKISIPDDRPSSTGIGASGILCLIIAFGFFVVMDGLNVFKVLGRKKSNPENQRKNSSVRPEHTKTDGNA